MEDKRVSLNGLLVYPFTSVEELLSYVDKNKGILVALGAEKIVRANNQMRGIVNRNLGYCDGIGAVKALKQKGFDAVKIPGCELWLRIIQKFYKEKTFYLIGATSDVIKETVNKLYLDYPGINIVNFRNGYIKTEEERKNVIDDIVAKKPDVVFVAMGSPKQELFMEEIQKLHPDAIYQGLGGSFNVYTGHVERAPQWWLDHNLEFLYRVFKEPSKIKRQIYAVHFAFRLLMRNL